ncbi:HIT family protein [Candidatus Woesearchaeota archaeon]|nr:HIT family protein [Candidatus Woesearchaeota archaeon]
MLFEDDDVFVMLSDEPWSVGHIIAVPKKHYPILEQVPDAVMGKLFDLANKASMCVFEGLGAQGTNVLVNNGIPAGQKVNHVVVNVIPRFENDGLDLSWTPKQASDEELNALEAKFAQEAAPKQEIERKPAEEYRPIRRIP